MAIINRDLGSSQQMRDFQNVITTTVGASAGAGFHAVQCPFPCTLKAVAVAANSVSGAPVIAIDIKRWSGAGVTTIAYAGSTLTVTAHGISTAYQSVSLAAAGSTLLSLQAGDVIVVNQLFSGGNVSAANMVVTAVLQATQDIVEHFGVNGT